MTVNYSNMLQILRSRGLIDDIPSIPSAIVNELYKYEIYENNNKEDLSRKQSYKVDNKELEEEHKYPTSFKKSLGLISPNPDKVEYVISDNISSSNVSSQKKDQHRRYMYLNVVKINSFNIMRVLGKNILI
jgi:hypothetical protein